MKRIIIDITQLVHWPGRLTGIPRVMNELALRFSKEDTLEVIFASWVKELQAMCVVNFGATMEQRGAGVVYRRLSENQIEGNASRLLPKSNSSSILKRAAKYGIRQTAHLNERLAGKLEARARRLLAGGYQRVAFGAEDVLFIPWGEWWDPRYIQKLKEWHNNGTRLAPIIHDVGPLVTPHLSGHSTASLGDFVKSVIPISAVTLVPSRNTKTDMISWLKTQGLQAPEVMVFRHGEDFDFTTPSKPADPAFAASGLKGHDYILCTGTIELKKNHLLLYYVYKLAKQRDVKLPKLLIVGRQGWKSETFVGLIGEDPEVNRDIVGLYDISDEELAWLYDHCLFTILPSQYEGWGIPIAESLARGVPCACSNTSSMTEVAPGIVEHFSPYSTDECLAVIQKLLNPKSYREALTRTKQFKRTSWDDTYRQVKTCLEQL